MRSLPFKNLPFSLWIGRAGGWTEVLKCTVWMDDYTDECTGLGASPRRVESDKQPTHASLRPSGLSHESMSVIKFRQLIGCHSD